MRLAAPPVEGRANEALVRFLAKLLGVAPSQIRLLSGESSGEKRLALDGVDAETLRLRLGIPPDQPLA